MGKERPIPTLSDYHLELLTQPHLRATGHAWVRRYILRETTKVIRYAQFVIESKPSMCWSNDTVAVLAKLEERMSELVGGMVEILIWQSPYNLEEQATWSRGRCAWWMAWGFGWIYQIVNPLYYPARTMIFQMWVEASVLCPIHRREDFIMDHITLYNSLFNWLYIDVNFHFALTSLILSVDLSLELYIYQIPYYYHL